MARFKVETPLPIGTSIADATKTARQQAVDQIGIQIVEQQTTSVNAKIVGPDGTSLVDSPNDESVDRILVTWWDVISGSALAGGQ